MNDPLEWHTSWRDHWNVVREIRMWIIVVVVVALVIGSMVFEWLAFKSAQYVDSGDNLNVDSELVLDVDRNVDNNEDTGHDGSGSNQDS